MRTILTRIGRKRILGWLQTRLRERIPPLPQCALLTVLLGTVAEDLLIWLFASLSRFIDAAYLQSHSYGALLDNTIAAKLAAVTPLGSIAGTVRVLETS
jgi:hypothetical protein